MNQPHNPVYQNPFSVAEQYRSAGYLGTLPLPIDRKEEPPRRLTGQSAPYPKDAQVENWLKGGPNNICLRLAECPGYVPKDHPPVGYELIVIDVDDYGEKHGADKLAALVEKLGALPATVRSSARFDTRPDSGHMLFLVPAGYRFLGKAATGIDIIQKGHRYVLVWPSRNPDANLATYRFKAVDGTYYDERPEGSRIPPLDDIAVLPEPWFDYLTCGGLAAVDIPISELTLQELSQWAKDQFNEPQGDMCRLVKQQLERQITKMEKNPDSHPNLVEAHAEFCYLGVEGHTGVIQAINEYSTKWLRLAAEKRDEIPSVGEINRSYVGILSKCEPQWRATGCYTPDDPCAAIERDEPQSVEEWLQLEDIDPAVADAIAAMDYGGLGPIVGKLERLEAKEPGDYDRNDRGNARHFIDLYGTNVKYVGMRKNWVVWDGFRWHNDPEDKLVNLSFEVVARRQSAYAQTLPMDDKASAAIKRLWQQWALRNGDKARVQSALSMAKVEYFADEPVAMNGKEFDSKPSLLACANGVLVLTDEPYLRDPTKEDYVTYNTNVEYHPWDVEYARDNGLEDAYRLWQDYLETFQPDPDMRRFIQKTLGHMLIGENPEKLIVFVYGPHDTGKSTLLNGIRSALGDYYGTVDINLFKPKDLNPGLIRAVPLRIVGMSEVDNNKMEAATIKRLTGNDEISAEAKNSNEIFTGRPQFTPVIACNSEPEIVNADEALRERVLILPFGNTIPASQRDYDKQDEMTRNSGPAVLAWLVEGWKMYRAEGLKRRHWPAPVRMLSGEVVSHFNPTQTFIHEHIDKYTDSVDGMRAWEEAKRAAKKRAVPAPEARDWPREWLLSSTNIFEIYLRWCDANRMPADNSKQFGKSLGLGAAGQRKIDGNNSRWYMGARLKAEEQ